MGKIYVSDEEYRIESRVRRGGFRGFWPPRNRCPGLGGPQQHETRRPIEAHRAFGHVVRVARRTEIEHEHLFVVQPDRLATTRDHVGRAPGPVRLVAFFRA